MMRTLSQTKTTGRESVSDVLDISKLTASQKEMMKKAVGQGLWDQILEGKPMASPVIKLIKAKMLYRNLLAATMWWEED